MVAVAVAMTVDRGGAVLAAAVAAMAVAEAVAVAAVVVMAVTSAVLVMAAEAATSSPPHGGTPRAAHRWRCWYERKDGVPSGAACAARWCPAARTGGTAARRRGGGTLRGCGVWGECGHLCGQRRRFGGEEPALASVAVGVCGGGRGGGGGGVDGQEWPAAVLPSREVFPFAVRGFPPGGGGCDWIGSAFL